ncbi:hypothetical protein HPO96_18320 [Kribbella sandramycini]|uniref:Flagellar basal body-associated protein FliL n=1 Tax=Kribbella sandramycini TaxID=60450 RepID=A0A7Y4L0S5_9ACTN|nr:hypothetical protein [Kribbella sandramycini]MBB6564500.1 flagellar basal body-associated protein FliL [Kribbella sandramycini]NOL42204.1 hypothetical protein [Kribbella sandramycini]
MTQTQSAPPTVSWSPPPPQQAPKQRGITGTWFDGTPGRMRAFLIVAAVVGVLFGLSAAQGFQQSEGALQRADANAAQLVRIQAIHTNLVSANADATNAFLVGGLEPPAQRQHFVDSMASAARLVADAASAQPADREVLGQLNTTLVTYQGLIEQARANNRQGLPIGSQYLRDANAVLQNDSLPLVKALVTANEKRVDTEFKGANNGVFWVFVAGLLAATVLLTTLRWLAGRTHRYLNIPILISTVVVVLTTLIGGFALLSASGQASDTRKGDYDTTLALSRARIAAYDARSNESLTLIARGSGEAYNKEYDASAAVVVQNLKGSNSTVLRNTWQAYQALHDSVRDDDNDGKWDLAVATATKKSVEAFAAFDKGSEAALTESGTAVTNSLRDAKDGLPPIGLLGLPIGIAVALLVAWGMSQRLGEYR